MAEDKPRLARLAAILTQLQAKRLVTAKEMADRHQVSIRTIYRDIRTLEQSGIPIITEEGKGYTIMEGYQLPPLMFTEAEALALITAEQLIQKNGNLQKVRIAPFQLMGIAIRTTNQNGQAAKEIRKRR